MSTPAPATPADEINPFSIYRRVGTVAALAVMFAVAAELFRNALAPTD